MSVGGFIDGLVQKRDQVAELVFPIPDHSRSYSGAMVNKTQETKLFEVRRLYCRLPVHPQRIRS